MHTSPDPTTERDGLPWWPVALGVVLALAALTLPWSARALADRDPRPVARAVAAPQVAAPTGGVVDAPVAGVTDPTEAAPPVPAASAARPRPAPGVPRRLLVPRLDVDAPVVPISAPGGTLLPPGDPRTLGWWSAGARPGAARGGALITGHTVHTGGGAFDDLDTLAPGDVVRVRTDRGVLEYAVTAVTVYRKATLARDAGRIFSQTVPGRLVLITCEDWNGTGYDSNAVVLARRV